MAYHEGRRRHDCGRAARRGSGRRRPGREKGAELSLVLIVDAPSSGAWSRRVEAAWSLPGARSASITVANADAGSVRGFHRKLGKKKNVWTDSQPGETAFLSKFLFDQTSKQLGKGAQRVSSPVRPARATAPTPDGNPKRLAVVDAVVAKVRKKETSKPRPVPPAALATLDLGPGKPLSPCLARWLAFDGAWVGLLDPNHPAFVAMRPSEIAREHLDLPPELVTRFAAAVDAVLPGDCFYVGNGSSGPCFLYAGVPDADGEYPIFYIDGNPEPVVTGVMDTIGDAARGYEHASIAVNNQGAATQELFFDDFVVAALPTRADGPRIGCIP